MHTKLARQVSDALAHEAATGDLERYVRGVFSNQRGDDPRMAREIEDRTQLAMGFIRSYVQAAPLLLGEFLASARRSNLQDELLPIFIAAEDYFLQSVDFIPDHLGLVGVVDDAYLSQRMLQCLSESHAKGAGATLIPFDLAPGNRLMRRMIGEPTAGELDAAVDDVLCLPDVYSAREVMARRIRQLEFSCPWPAAPGEQAHDEMDLHLGMLGSNG